LFSASIIAAAELAKSIRWQHFATKLEPVACQLCRHRQGTFNAAPTCSCQACPGCLACGVVVASTSTAVGRAVRSGLRPELMLQMRQRRWDLQECLHRSWRPSGSTFTAADHRLSWCQAGSEPAAELVDSKDLHSACPQRRARTMRLAFNFVLVT